ncbi:hypothetical protein WS63_18730 [Burkholderia stagnalis]|nr:hypothetical protein WS63_18730 [Burkholderia stagnalis]
MVANFVDDQIANFPFTFEDLNPLSDFYVFGKLCPTRECNVSLQGLSRVVQVVVYVGMVSTE